MVCNICFCSEFPDIPDKARRKATTRRRKTGNWKALCVPRKRKACFFFVFPFCYLDEK